MPKAIQDTIIQKTFLLLLAITMLGGFLRFYQLAQYPVSLSIDEVMIAYDAKSIAQTGKDHYGERLPLAFYSVGDYKPPVLVYLMAPVVALLGLTEFSTRLTIALLGILTIPLVFLVIKQLSSRIAIALTTALLVAISPWHIEFSRSSFEAVLALFLVMCGVALFLAAIQKRPWVFVPAMVLFGLSIYAYHAERVFTPLLVLTLVYVYRNQIGQYMKQFGIAVVIGLVVMLPYLSMLTSPQIQTRAKTQFITRDTILFNQLHKPGEPQTFTGQLFDNNLVMISSYWAKRYLNYFDPKFLFVSGMQYSHPNNFDMGLFYLWEAVFMLYGAYLIFVKNMIRSRLLIGVWLLLGPLTASLTINEQHPLRSLPMIPIPQLLTATGIIWIFDLLRRKATLFSRGFVAVLASIVVVSLVYWYNIYTIQFPWHFSEYRMYGMKEVAQYALAHKDEYEEIIIDPVLGSEGPYTYGIPYAYVLFYGDYDPVKFQTSKRRLAEDIHSVNYENFTFRQIYWPSDKDQRNRLFIGSMWSLPPQDVPKEKIIKKLQFKNGIDSYFFVSTK